MAGPLPRVVDPQPTPVPTSTRRAIKEVVPRRDLDVTWRSYCLEIRDDYGVASTFPEELRDRVMAKHAASHRMLRFFGDASRSDDPAFLECLTACGLDADLLDAGDDSKWDKPIVEAMDAAYAFGGHKAQTPVIVVRSDPPHGFKGPVMALAPTGERAVRLWDAIQVLSRDRDFFEMTRPRTSPPRPPKLR